MLELWNCKLTAGVTACVFCDAFVFFPLGHDLDRWSVEPHVKQRPQSLSACPVLWHFVHLIVLGWGAGLKPGGWYFLQGFCQQESP